MYKSRNTLICTVGTSLFEGNLERLNHNNNNFPHNWKEIKTYYRAKDWEKLAKEMLKLNPSDRICGAEINTIEEVNKRKLLDLKNIIFLVSDTEKGRNTGKFLEIYYNLRNDLKLDKVKFDFVEDLQDENPANFKIKGLRNLVRKMGSYIEMFGGVSKMAIDATGGYKAQIAIAVIIGQALNIPVFYKHEKFSEIIDFPPLPISFDYDILGENSKLLIDFERGEVFSSDEINSIDEKLRVLLTEIEVDNKTLYELSPIGQIYLTSFRLRYPKAVKLTPAEERKEPKFREDNFPIGFKEFVYKVWRDNKWIVTTKSMPYDRQKSIKGIGFYVRDNKLIGEYQDKNNFGARFRIFLTDNSNISLNWAADKLNQKYS